MYESSWELKGNNVIENTSQSPWLSVFDFPLFSLPFVFLLISLSQLLPNYLSKIISTFNVIYLTPPESEKWLDVRDVQQTGSVLAAIMSARLDIAVNKSCDGVEGE